MVAETLTAARAADNFPVYKGRGAGDLCAAYGTYEVAANVEDGDIFEMCVIPAGAVILGGFFYADDLDTGTETIDLDIGWAANGGSGTYDSADPDGLGNFGVLTGDAVTGLKPEVGTSIRLGGNFLNGDLPTFTAETTIQVEANAAAATFAAGAISLVVFYVVP
jgi:hypothetical protein